MLSNWKTSFQRQCFPYIIVKIKTLVRNNNIASGPRLNPEHHIEFSEHQLTLFCGLARTNATGNIFDPVGRNVLVDCPSKGTRSDCGTSVCNTRRLQLLFLELWTPMTEGAPSGTTSGTLRPRTRMRMRPMDQIPQTCGSRTCPTAALVQPYSTQ